MFLREKVSDAAAKTAISFARAARASLRPRMFGTSTGKLTPSRRLILASTAEVSAICGTHLGETKLPASMTRKPVRLRRSISSILISVATILDSFCRPSRGPTSTSFTDVGKVIAAASHAEDAELRGRDRRVRGDLERAAKHVARRRGRDHAVIPQTRTRVIRMALRGVLLAHGLGALPILFLFGLGGLLRRILLDPLEDLR